MRHAVFIEPGKVEWREAPDPVLEGATEALVRPEAGSSDALYGAAVRP